MRRRTGRLRAALTAALLAALAPILATFAVWGASLTGCVSTVLDREQWLEVTTENFHVVSNADEATSVEFARSIELMRAIFTRATTASRFEPRVPTHVYMFPNPVVAREFGLGALGSGVLGYFADRLSANYAVAYGAFKPGWVIGHEYVHFLLRNQSAVQYPSWYDEGLAEFLSSVAIEGGEVQVGVPPVNRLVVLQRSPRRISLERLFSTLTYRDLPERDRGLFYPQAWLTTHYFFLGQKAGFPDRSQQATSYLRLLNQGHAPEEAFPHAFGADFEAVEREIERYLRLPSLPHLSVQLSSLDPGDVLGVRPLPLDEALTRLGELHVAVGELDAASRWKRHARRLFVGAVELNPANARAQAGIGGLETDTRRAEDRFRKALELSPEDAMIHAACAEWLRRRAERRGSSGSDEKTLRLLRRARTHYARSIELDPQLPLAHAGLGSTYTLEGRDFEAGIRSLERARSLLPGNLTLALWLGEIHYEAGHPAKARSHLETVQRWSHGGEELKRATRLLRKIEEEASALSGG